MEMNQTQKNQSFVHQQELESCMVKLANQWKGLESQFLLTNESLQTRFEELRSREKQLGDHESKLEALTLQSEAKAEELRRLEQLTEARQREAEEGKTHLDSIKLLIEKNSEELVTKEERFSEVEKLIREKELEYESIKGVVKEKLKELNWVENKIEQDSREIEAKEKQLRYLKGSLSKCRDMCESRENHLNEIESLIEKRKIECDLKEVDVQSAQKLIEEACTQLVLKKQELGSLEEYSEKVMKSMESKMEAFNLHSTAMLEWSSKLETKGRELEEFYENLNLEKMFGPRIAELGLIEKRALDFLNEIELKGTQLETWERSIEDRENHLSSVSFGLATNKRKLEEQSKELQFKEHQFYSFLNSAEEHIQKMKSKESPSTMVPEPEEHIQKMKSKESPSTMVPEPGSNVIEQLRGKKRSSFNPPPQFQRRQHHENRTAAGDSQSSSPHSRQFGTIQNAGIQDTRDGTYRPDLPQ